LFKDYAFLWTQDINTVFKEFLAGNLQSRPQYGDEDEGGDGKESVEPRSASEAEGRLTRASLHSRSSSVKFIIKEIR